MPTAGVGTSNLADPRAAAVEAAGAEVIDNEVIRTRENPVAESGGTCVLQGNLAPSGCVIKSLAAD